MSEPLSSDDALHYVGILEAVVAVLAIKCGLDPETMMANAIEDITEQSGMETVDTERIIRSRWDGRHLSAATLAAQALPVTLGPKPLPELEKPPPAASAPERFQEYKQRKATSTSENESDVTEQS